MRVVHSSPNGRIVLFRSAPRGVPEPTEVDQARHARWLAGETCAQIARETGFAKSTIERSVDRVRVALEYAKQAEAGQ